MPRSPQIVRLAGAFVFVLSTIAVAQNGPSGAHPDGSPMARDESSLVENFAELRAKVARLEAALEQNHRGHSSRGGDGAEQPDMGNMSRMGGDGMKGMKDMKSGEKKSMGMEGKGMGEMSTMSGRNMKGQGMSQMDGMKKMDGMGGMKMMGKMKGMSGGMGEKNSVDDSGGKLNSALPGFPGASHLYHVGATGFFLNHDEHITLTAEQTIAINKIKEQSVLADNTAGRQAEEAEQQLWELTAVDTPEAKLIEEKVREIERLRGDQRLRFIRAVGKAARVLTAEQRQTLVGMEPAQPATDTPDAQPASDAAQHQH